MVGCGLGAGESISGPQYPLELTRVNPGFRRRQWINGFRLYQPSENANK
jgi:hypothetical protein